MYHSLTILGNTGREPEMKFLPSGDPVCTFSVAVSDGYGDKKKTIWVKVSAWGKTAEAVNNYLHKGDKVLCSGKLQASENGNPRSWLKDGEAHAAFEMRADTVTFLGSKQENKEEPI